MSFHLLAAQPRAQLSSCVASRPGLYRGADRDVDCVLAHACPVGWLHPFH